jgi:RimJ/RimL family protein N-acetyltransferase
MTLMPELETGRLIIREFMRGDLDSIHRILNAGFGASPIEERRFWLDWVTRNYLALAHLYQPPYGDRAVTLKDTGLLIGAVGFVPSLMPFQLLPSFRVGNTPESRFSQPEFGLFWAVAPEHQRRGYATEAARAMIDYAFNVLKLRRVVATTDYDNLASQAVMRRLGMTIEQNPTPGDPPWFQVVGVLANPSTAPVGYTAVDEWAETEPNPQFL